MQMDAHACDMHLDSAWQDRNAVTRFSQLKIALDGKVSADVLSEMQAGLDSVGMSIRLNPYVMSLMDWSQPEIDPIRRQFLPMSSELESDHPCLTVDSLEERDHSPVAGLVHRYPDKVLFLVTSVCPVYCQYCTRSYAVGADTALVQKDHVTSPQFWEAAIDYIKRTPQIEDVVISGGDVARLKAAHLRGMGNALLDIGHIRRIRFATKSLAVQPMKFLSDEEWVGAFLEVFSRGRDLFKHVCLHTHFNHPREVTSIVERAMRRLHQAGIVVRNQTVLLRGVNDDAQILIDLIRSLGRIHIHPYYVYLCDMVKGTEHFRLPLQRAQELEKQVRGSTAGFNTPQFIVDTPGGKRHVHSNEFYDRALGIPGFVSPAVSPGQVFHYFDPLRTLVAGGRQAWQNANTRENILASLSSGLPLAVAAE
jgi:lysine 2,3-aminomutase